MSLTPVEIRHLQLGRSLRGYSTATVDRLLAEIADAFENVWRERADLADRVEQLETDLAKHRETDGRHRARSVSIARRSPTAADTNIDRTRTIGGDQWQEQPRSAPKARWRRPRAGGKRGPFFGAAPVARGDRLLYIVA